MSGHVCNFFFSWLAYDTESQLLVIRQLWHLYMALQEGAARTPSFVIFLNVFVGLVVIHITACFILRH
jgi:hypothetical protein